MYPDGVEGIGLPTGHTIMGLPSDCLPSRSPVQPGEPMRSVHSLAATAAAVALLVFGAHAVAQDSALQFTQRRPETAQAVPGKALTAPSSAAPAAVVHGYLRGRGADGPH